jgi:hypothetical protein
VLILDVSRLPTRQQLTTLVERHGMSLAPIPAPAPDEPAAPISKNAAALAEVTVEQDKVGGSDDASSLRVPEIAVVVETDRATFAALIRDLRQEQGESSAGPAGEPRRSKSEVKNFSFFDQTRLKSLAQQSGIPRVPSFVARASTAPSDSQNTTLLRVLLIIRPAAESLAPEVPANPP